MYSGFPVPAYGKPQCTLWPTQYFKDQYLIYANQTQNDPKCDVKDKGCLDEIGTETGMHEAGSGKQTFIVVGTV